MDQSHKVSRRPTIGFLVDNLLDSYEDGVRRAIMQEAEAADANLICFLGGPAWGQRQGRVIYDLVGPENVDGIIAISGCLDLGEHGNTPGCSEGGALEALFRQYAPLPVVSIGKLVRGSTSLLVENGSGVRELVDHFIELHGLQRIAFIRGPAENEEADARFAAYRSALEHHGLPYEPTRVFQGDFSVGSGLKAVSAFLDERRVELDAIVAANDYMAIDAMQELQRRGLKVPGNVAVGGFDDIRNALSTVPSLSTVRQPMRTMARTAVENVLARIQGEAVPELTRFPTEMVIRRSCGCMVQLDEVKEIGDFRSDGGQSLASARSTFLTRRLEALFPWVGERIRVPTWSEELASTLFDELERSFGNRFLTAFERLGIRGFECGITAAEWQRVAKTIFGTARRQVGSHLSERLDQLREYSLIIAGSLAEQFQAALNAKMEQEAQILQRIFRFTGADEEETWQSLQRELPKMGISSFFQMTQVPEMADKVSLGFHYSHDDNVVLDTSIAPCPAKQLVPGRFTQAHRWTYIVLPIHFGLEQMGFAVSGLGDVSGAALEFLVYQLSRAIKTGHLVKEIRRHVSELEAKIEGRNGR